MTRFLACFAISLSLSLSSAASAKELTREDLPPSYEHMMRGSTEQTIRNLAQQMVSIHPKGIINQETIEQSVQIEMAQRRSSRMHRFLPMDLNFDGQITREEMDTIAQYGRTNQRDWIELELLRIEADADGDGNISYDELRGSVARATADEVKTVREKKLNIDFFVLDLDENGEVTIGEMAQAIRSIMAK